MIPAELGLPAAKRGGAIVAFILGTILFVLLIGALDARWVPWPRPGSGRA
jgi:hypothetical protein